MIHEELCVTNHEGFIATDVNVGSQYAGQKVMVSMTVISENGEKSGVHFQTTTTVDKEGFLQEDLFLDEEHPHRNVNVVVKLA